MYTPRTLFVPHIPHAFYQVTPDDLTAELFDEMDTDQDGKLSRGEWIAKFGDHHCTITAPSPHQDDNIRGMLEGLPHYHCTIID